MIKIGSKYDQICSSILKKQGPLLGNELRNSLVRECDITNNNARQIINRIYRNGIFLSSSPVKFKHQELLYYLPNQSIVDKLKQIIPNHAKNIYRIYQALIEEEGFLFWSEFEKVSAGGVGKSKHKRETATRIFQKMKQLGVVDEIYDFQGTPVVVSNKNWYKYKIPNTSNLFKRMWNLSFTQKLTRDLLNWLERMNFVGWNASYVTDTEEKTKGYNGYYFDAISYTYLWGLYRTDSQDDLYNPAKEKAGSPVVIESILHRKVKLHDISGFITRVANLYGPVKNKRNFKIIPVCFAESIEKDALDLARSRGIMVINISEVFGKQVVESLRTIRNIDVKNIETTKLFDILKSTEGSEQDGKLGSLKGYVFNFLVASIFSDYGFRPTIGMKYQDPEAPEKQCECDIVITLDEAIIICEVKGYNKDNRIELGKTGEDEATVKRHFERSYKIVKKNTTKEVFPIFITSAGFTEEALAYLDKRNNGKKVQRFLKEYNYPRKIYYNREDLMELFGNKRKYTEHRKILKEFFGRSTIKI